MDQEPRPLTLPRAARLTGMLAAALLVGGCPASLRTTTPDLPPTSAEPATIPAPAPPATAPAPSPPPQPPRENHLSAATRSLVTQAHTLMSQGDFDAASSTLDRALRIEPNNPLLWIERGRLRLAEKDARQAEGCGRKALVLAGGDPNAQRQAGRLLADALLAQGRNPEAHDIESRPYMH